MSGDPARRLAEELGRRGLTVPARLLLDAHRPLAPLLADLGAAVSPLINLGRSQAPLPEERLLDDPDAVDRVISELDRIEERRAGSR